MWLLHVVAVSGNGPWQSSAVFTLLVLLLGGGFAGLAGEAGSADALLLNLALAAAGGLIANAIARPFGTDLIAYVYGVRLFITVLGSILLLALAHDAVRYVALDRDAAHGRRLIISDVGGFQYLYTWLSGWPSEEALCAAVYDDGLQIKLLADALHYQVRSGPFIGSETVPVARGARAEARGTVLRVMTDASDGEAAIALPEVRPADALERIVVRFNELTGPAISADR